MLRTEPPGAALLFPKPGFDPEPETSIEGGGEEGCAYMTLPILPVICVLRDPSTSRGASGNPSTPLVNGLDRRRLAGIRSDDGWGDNPADGCGAL
jgi:hypothetical protein